MKVYSTNPKGERIELTNEPQEVRVIIPRKFAYAQAWKDLRNEFIDQLTDKESGVIHSEDLKKAMDEMIYDYEI